MDINDVSIGRTVIINCDIINDGLFASIYNNEVCTVAHIGEQSGTVYLTNDRIANDNFLGDGTVGVNPKWIRVVNIYDDIVYESGDILI